MKQSLSILILLLFLLPLGSEENLNRLDQQALALWDAHDYAAASKIYEQLLTRSLPDWQQNRLLYNLGTIRLAQHQAMEALTFFEKIKPADLSLLAFGRDLFLNEGIAYLQYAQSIALASSSSFDQQALFIEQGLEAFNQAQALDCEEQKEEQTEESSFSCHPYPLLDQWIKTAHLQLHNVHQQKRQQWNGKANIESLTVPLQQARLSYEDLLLQESLTLPAIENLLAQFESLDVDKEHTHSLDQIKERLQKSIKELRSHHPMQARFFLVAGFSPIDSFFKEKNAAPSDILRRAIDQAGRTWLLFFLFERITDKSSNQTELFELLKNQQHNILVQAKPFIPAVLNEQNIRFHQAKNRSAACQQSPWDQVIPLYDRGYRAAQIAENLIDKTPLDSQAVFDNQEQTIEEWQMALNLILHPPQQNQQNSSSPLSQNLSETFRQIQEMYMEDQSQPEQKTEELHSW